MNVLSSIIVITLTFCFSVPYALCIEFFLFFFPYLNVVFETIFVVNINLYRGVIKIPGNM